MDIISFFVRIVGYTKILGAGSFIIAFALIVINYWGIFLITNQNFVDGLYIYAALNLGIFSPFFYLDKRRKKATAKTCPYCNAPLEELPKYKCSKCGILKFEKE